MATTKPTMYTATIFTCPACKLAVEATVHVTFDVSLDRTRVTEENPLAVGAQVSTKIEKITIRHDCEMDGIAARLADTTSAVTAGQRGI